MNFDLKKILNRGEKKNEKEVNNLPEKQEETQELYYINQNNSENLRITPEEILAYEKMSDNTLNQIQTPQPQVQPQIQSQTQSSNLSSIISQMSATSAQTAIVPETKMPSIKKEKKLFEAASCIEDLKLNQILIEDLALKFIFYLGECTGLELGQKLRIPVATVLDPVLMTLNDNGFITILRSSGLGGHNKVYRLTEKGFSKAKNAIAVSSYVGPVPVSLDDYIKAVNSYAPLKIPSLDGFRKFYEDLVVKESFLEDLAIAFSSEECIFLYGEPGMGKTTFVKRLVQCYPDSIKVPFAVHINGAIIKFFDESFHKPINPKFTIDGPIENNQVDSRWVDVKRPCILVSTEFSAKHGTNIQYDVTGTTAFFPLTTKANGGVFIIDDFGRQEETPEQILNLWIEKLESSQDILMLKSGQQFYVPYTAMTIFTTNLEPANLIDPAFLRRLSYKLKVPSTDIESYCQIFANESDNRKIYWEDEILEYLIQTYYSKGNRSLASNHPRDILARVEEICRYRGIAKPYTLTQELIDKAWHLHFL